MTNILRKKFLIYLTFSFDETLSKRFFQEIKEKDLFPEKIEINGNQHSYSVQTHNLNTRKKHSHFVTKVRKRFHSLEEYSSNVILRQMLNILKENGTENDDEQYVLNKSTLQKVSQFSLFQFEETLKYGIKKLCLKMEKKRNKVRIILISEDIDEDEDTEFDIYFNEKRLGKEIFKIVKQSGFENEKEESVCREDAVMKKLGIEIDEFRKVLNFCKKEKCIRTYDSKNKTYLVLINDKFDSNLKKVQGFTGLTKKLIHLLKKSKDETEEGYLYVSEDYCLLELKISATKLEKVVEYGLMNSTFKFEVLKKLKIVVYTKERKLDVLHL